jgi:hypothetical protein
MLSCNVSTREPTSLPTPTVGSTSTSVPVTETFTPVPPTPTSTITLTFTPLPTETPTPRPVVDSLDATVTAGRLSCRYGPGPEYLYLFAFRAGANIKLIGRVNADNWPWVLVENQVPCWVHTEYLSVSGDVLQLPDVYPDSVRLPITPYYPRSEVLSAERDRETNQVTISWLDVPVSLGDYEDDSMQTYIVELWRCENGRLIFDPIGTRLTFLTFVDEPGCSEPSHGRVFVQEKHGYAGPAEISWPEY